MISNSAASGVFEKVVDEVRRTTAVPSAKIRKDSELYLDLRISGDDLYNLIGWIVHEFGVDFRNMNLRDYAPQEGADPNSDHRGIFKRVPYKSLTIEKLLAAIDRGAWVD